VVSVLTLGVSAAPVGAWNKSGHMISGAIAYAVLKKENPETIGRIVTALKKHPHYEPIWVKRLGARNISAANRDLYLFMTAAQWPDKRRISPQFTPPQWLFVDLPFNPGGKAASVTPAEPDPDNVLRAYALNLSILQHADATPAEKAVSLCWIFHLVGD